MEEVREKMCPYCQGVILDSDKSCECSICHVPHHKQCWEENRGCTTFGCFGTPTHTSANSTVKIWNESQPNRSYNDGSETYSLHRNEDSTVYCVSCGSANNSKATFCSVCGYRLNEFSSKKAYEANQQHRSNSTYGSNQSYDNVQGYQSPCYEGGRYNYAGFWKRFAAALLDGFILTIGGSILAACIIPSVIAEGDPSSERFVLLIPIIVIWLYYSLMESSSKQATLGKLAVGIYVADSEGNRISFCRATGRHFGKIISGIILSIGYIMAGFTEKKQALHDIMADCLVLSK